MKGGFRVVSTIEERDAIPTGARKQGMRVLVINDSFNEYTLSGGTSNTSWQITQHLAKEHNHQISDVADLQMELDGKAPAMHSHTVDDVTGLQTLLDSEAPTAHSHTFDDVAGLQVSLDSKAPTVHGHTLSEVSGLQTALDGKASATHTHSITDVTGLQTELDGKAPTLHGHAVADVTGLQTELDGKALTVHGHTVSAIAGLQTMLDAKAPTTHSHAVADVAGLQTALDGKAATTHVHTIANVTGLQTALDGKAASSHVHTIANVTGLQTALDGKSDTTHTHAVATTTVNGLMSSADKTKLDGVASGANNYVHPATDGSLHVPATSTTNNLKVLKAGATAGSIAWGNVAYSELTGVPSTFAPSAHTHAISDVTGLQTALDGKLATTGTAANSSKLQGYVTATGATANTVALRDSAGKITAVDFTMTSDARLKNILSTLDDEAALQQVLRWESVFYQMKGETRIMPGFIAQQIQQISPELVTDNEEFLSVSYALTSAYYAGAIRAIMKRIA